VSEGRQLFPEHTVRENLELGAYRNLRAGKRNEFAKNLADVFELFFPASGSVSNSRPAC